MTEKRLFALSLLIIVSRLITLILQIKDLSEGMTSHKDFVQLGFFLVMIVLLLTVSSKFWRLGLLFVLASHATQYLSNLVSKNSTAGALFLSVFSISLLAPALFYFYKLRRLD